MNPLQLIAELVRRKKAMRGTMPNPNFTAINPNMAPGQAMPPPDASGGGGAPMEPDSAGILQRGAQAQTSRLQDEEIEGLYAKANQDELDANNEPLPTRGRGINKRNIGPLLIGQLLSTLLLKDREGQFAKGAMGVIEGQEEQKFQDQVMKLQQKKQERLIQAQQAYQGAVRKEGQIKDQRSQANSDRQFGEQQRQFNAREANDLEATRVGNQGKISVAQLRALKDVPPEARAAFARGVLGITDPDVLANLDVLTPKEKKEVAGAGNLDAKTLTENALRGPKAAELKARAKALMSKAGLDSTRAAQVAKETDWMDEEKSVKIGKATAEIAKLKEATRLMPAEIATKWATSNIKQLTELNKNIATGMKAITTEANSTRNLISKLEAEKGRALKRQDDAGAEKIEVDIRFARQRLGTLNKMYTDNAQQAAELRARLSLQGSDIQGGGLGGPKTEGGGPQTQGGPGIGAVAQAAKQAGFKGEALTTAIAIAIAESSGRANAHNPNASTGDNSYGLWQINMLGGMGPERLRKFGLSANDELFDPAKNAKAAFQISGGGKNWKPWTTYTSGKYKQFMDVARRFANQ